MPTQVNLDHITIVLHQPRFAENIGSTARAAMNLGLRHITLVNPEDTDRERMGKLATHAAAGLLEAMEIKPSLAEALAPFHYIVGTTARLGGKENKSSPRPGPAKKFWPWVRITGWPSFSDRKTAASATKNCASATPW